ncbi:hypothetical protein [Conexibacter sp. CPCC 206217]|uniref:hypothetical protein n=1 Tax=Conexibacter sp. CPCC 206217 TaxID=3064574 RepID=UPI002725E02E|nr:hypothetical protein [Conexibacter sp. CPCC 206217]MDO8211979.1 hypothetical protein [Conexibacter sp. CPCC 206217]
MPAVRTRPAGAVATTRVVCVGESETGRGIAACAARHSALELVAAVSPREASVIGRTLAQARADVALLAPASRDAASALVTAVVAAGADAVLLLPAPGWSDDELARHSAAAAAAGTTLLLIESEHAFVADMLPAVLAMACVTVDRVDVRLPAVDSRLPDRAGAKLSGLLRGETAEARVPPTERELPCARISIVGEGNIEFAMEGEAIRDGGRAALMVNSIPTLLRAAPGLHRLMELPLPHAWTTLAEGAA